MKKILFHKKSQFLKSLEKMLRAGGSKQQAREKVIKILGEINVGSTELGN